MDITSRWFNYLHTQRKLTSEVIHLAALEEVNGLLKIPIFDAESHFIFSKYRKAPWDTTSTPKYQYDKGAKVALYGADHMTSDIVITEGELDTLSLINCGFNACSSTGGALSFQEAWAPLFENKNITLLFDNDETGIKGAVKTALILKNVLFRWIPPVYGKDVSDVLSNYGEEKVQELMKDGSNVIDVCVPPIHQKKAYIAYRRHLKEKVRTMSTGSIGSIFIRTLINELSIEIRHFQKPKHHASHGDEVARAKQYPVQYLLKVQNRKAVCPFHDEKTGSLHVYPDNHTFCFGACNKAYDAIAIAMKVHGWTFKEAVRELSK